ncbi:unnamed protein product, partial [marine sediment metagenome]
YIVFAALSIAVIFFTIKFGIEPFLESQQRVREKTPVKIKQLEKYRQFVAGKAQAEKNLKRIQALTKRGYLKMLAGETSPLAAAHLQDTLKTLSAKNLINIKSEKVLDTKTMDFFERIPVQIEFTSTITNLTNFLYDIETYGKLLIITDLNIRVTSRRNPRDVRATLVVAGFMKGGKMDK